MHYRHSCRRSSVAAPDDAANVRCGGNLETTRVVCDSVLVTYKQEMNGVVDYASEGTQQNMCRP